MRRGVKVVAVLFLLLLLFALGGLTAAHMAIRDERPSMPDVSDVIALGQEKDLPLRLSWVKTSTQSDPKTTIVHAAFVLEWSDGRIVLVDAGMDPETARNFGRPAQWLLGSDPVVVGRPIDQAIARVRDHLVGLVFTHLHTDHTQGIGLLCSQGARPFDVFMTRAQFERPNYTTRMGLGPVEDATCAHRVPLADEGLVRLPGLPGVGVIRAAGHTPGSQLVVAWVGEQNPRGFVLAGDVVFGFDQIINDEPKPLVYRLLITPEGEGQLARVRPWLRTLSQEHGMTVVPSHDLAHLESVGLAQFDLVETDR